MGATNFDDVVASTFTGAFAGLLTGGVKSTIDVASADGAISVVDVAKAVVVTKAGVCAMTLADPAVADNGKFLLVISTTAYAHTVTNTTGFNGSGTAGDVATFGAAAGNSILLFAYGQKWYAVNLTGVTLG